MKYSFSIHGVPNGCQAWGDINDSEYLKSFYNSVSATSVPAQMIVDIRYSGNILCSYYHYLILSNVFDCSYRPGSYFGMTVCFESAYCSDFAKLYELFDECFKQVVLNSVLVKSGDQYKYMFSDFDSANNNATLRAISNALREYIPQFESKLVPFPINFSPKHRNDGFIENWSVDDVGNKTFVDIFLRDSMVSISPFYPVSHKKVEILQGENRAKDAKIQNLESNNDVLRAENAELQANLSEQKKSIDAQNTTIQYKDNVISSQNGKIASLESKNGNLQNENSGLKARLSTQEKDIASKGTKIKQQFAEITAHQNTIANLNTENANLTKQLTETRQQVDSLKEELKQAQNNRDDETLQKCLSELKTIAHKRAQTDQLIDSISSRLKDAEENIEHIDNQLNKKRAFKLTSHNLLLGGLVIVAIIAIAGIVLPTKNPDMGGLAYDTVTASDVQGMINESLKPINRTLNDISKKVDNINTKDYFSSELYGDSAFDYDGDEISFIDIQYGGSTVTGGATYKLTAKKGNVNNRQTLTTGGGAFIVKLPNGSEQQLESNDNGITASLYVHPEWSSFTIIYRYNNKEKSRNITVVAP